MIRRFFAAAAASLALGIAAGPAHAEPATNQALRLVASAEGAVMFVAEQAPARRGQTIEVWSFGAFRTLSGQPGSRMIGVWFRLRFDCDAGTVHEQEAVALSERLSVILRSSDGREGPPAEGSPSAALQAHLCEGAPLPETRFQGVSAAANYAQAKAI